jgi:two-component system sensor histidine kinase/response regulator
MGFLLSVAMILTRIHAKHGAEHLSAREAFANDDYVDRLKHSENIREKKDNKQFFDALLVVVQWLFCLLGVVHTTLRYANNNGRLTIQFYATPFLALLLDSKRFKVVVAGFVAICCHLVALLIGVYSSVLAQDRIYAVSELYTVLGPAIPVYYFLLVRYYQMYQIQAEADIHEQISAHKNFMLETLLSNLPAIVWTIDSNLGITFCRGAGFSKVKSEHVTEKNFGSLVLQDKQTKDSHLQALQGHTNSFTHCFPFIPDVLFKTSLAPFKNERGVICGVIGLALDVTELMEAQEALSRSEANYRSLIESTTDLIVKIDPTYKILFSNQSVLNIVKEDLVGTPFLDWFAGDKREEVLIKLRELFQTRATCSWEWESQSLDGKYVTHYASRASPIIRADNVVEATVTSVDITEKKKAQEQERIADEMRVASKSKSEFICQMSHELRNPMNAIIGSLQLLACTDNLSKIQAEHISDASDNAKLLLAIISDVLDLAKIESGKLEIVNEPANLVEIIETTAGMMGNQADSKGLQIYTKIDTAIPEKLLCDKNRISQILMNFSSNSFKFTNSGYISLSVELLEDYRHSSKVRFSCKDTGIGIRTKHLNTIFQPFVQIMAKNQEYNPTTHKGWGLGLEICSRLAQLMNGIVGVESVYGKGSTFYFDITLKKVNSTPIGALLTHSDFNMALIVEYKEEFKSILKHYLKALHVEHIASVSSCDTVEQVLQQWNNHNTNNNRTVILADSELKDRLIHLVTKDCRLILLNRPTNNQAHSHAIAHDNVVNLRKPLRLSRLMNALIEDQDVQSTLSQDADVRSLSTLPLSDNSSKLSPSDLEILCVEDSAINKKIMIFMLKKLGIIKIDSADNGVEGLDLVSKRDRPYNLIFMDLQMPLMGGDECTTKIRQLADQAKAQTPIVAVTANADVRTIENCLSLAFNDVLTKPVSIEKLVQLIQTYCL